MKTSTFLNLIFERCEGGYLVIWQYKGKKARRYAIDNADDMQAAAQFIYEHRTEALYFNVATQREKGTAAKRGTKDDLFQLPFIWIDFDLDIKPNKKNPYPPREHAEAALNDMPLKPSLMVATGGGLHAYWLFDEPLDVSTRELVEKWERDLTQPWLELLRDKLKRYGSYTIDGTQDITRTLRVIGTVRENGHIVDVLPPSECVNAKARYAIEDLTQFTEGAAGEKRQKNLLDPRTIKVGELTYRIDAVPPFDKFEALRANDPKFRRTWEHKRDDLTDRSPSGYTMALANYGAMANWSNQEIADLIIAWRRKESCLEEKAEDTLRKTEISIQKARVAIEGARAAINSQRPPEKEPTKSEKAIDAIRETLDKASSEPVQHTVEHASSNGTAPTAPRKISDKTREVLINQISEALGVPVAKWIKVGTENAQYRLELEGGQQIPMGGSTWMRDPHKFTRAIYDHTTVNTEIKKKGWPAIVTALGLIAELQDAPELAIKEKFLSALRAYLKARSIYSADQMNIAFVHDAPFEKDGYIYWRRAELMNWLATWRGVRMEPTDIASAQSILGLAAHDVKYWDSESKKSICRSYFRIQKSLLLDSGDEDELIRSN